MVVPPLCVTVTCKSGPVRACEERCSLKWPTTHPFFLDVLLRTQVRSMAMVPCRRCRAAGAKHQNKFVSRNDGQDLAQTIRPRNTITDQGPKNRRSSGIQVYTRQANPAHIWSSNMVELCKELRRNIILPFQEATAKCSLDILSCPSCSVKISISVLSVHPF